VYPKELLQLHIRKGKEKGVGVEWGNSGYVMPA